MRASYKVDFPPEWNKRKKAGLCPVCAKPKEEFEKGRQIYCSAACADKYSDHFITWQDLREKVISKSPKCEECGITAAEWEEKKEAHDKKLLEDYEKLHEKEIGAIKTQLYAEAEKRFLQLIKEIDEMKADDYSISRQLEKAGIPLPQVSRERFKGFEVDHRVAIMNGGDQWDEANLRVLCHDCHLKKTAHDHRKRVDSKENAKANAGSLYEGK